MFENIMEFLKDLGDVLHCHYKTSGFGGGKNEGGVVDS